MQTALKSVDALPNDLQSLGLSDADIPEIEILARTIQTESPLSVAQFGRGVGEHTSGYADSMLDQVRNKDLDEAGSKLTEVVSAAKALSKHGLSDARSRIPVIGGLIDRFAGRGNKILAEFESTRTQIERLVGEVEQVQTGLSERNTVLEEMFSAIRQEHRMLGIHIAAGKRRLSEMQIVANDLRSNVGNDPSRLQQVCDMDAMLANLDKRIGDLLALQQAAMQSLPTIRLVQSNNQALVSKFHSIKEVTLPAWKHQFLLRLSLNEQRNAVDLAHKIDETTNSLLRSNADLLHRNSVETARSNQRLVIDVDTLREVQDSLIKTVEDVIQIQKDGVVSRQRAEKEIHAMRIDLRKKLTRTEGSKELN